MILNRTGTPNTKQDGRIFGGYPLNITQVPWQVSLHDQNGKRHFCGGSIISDRWILTAAHCIPRWDPSYNVRVGATHKYNDGQLVTAQKVIIHEKFAASVEDYDYALIQLDEPLQFTDAIQPIPLPNVGDAPTGPGTVCLISGWGATLNVTESTDILRAANIPIVEQRKCAKAHATRPVTTRMICAGNEKADQNGEFNHFFFERICLVRETMLDKLEIIELKSFLL